jgi:hypothetical protein
MSFWVVPGSPVRTARDQDKFGLVIIGISATGRMMPIGVLVW